MDFRVKLLPLIIGGVLFFIGWQEWRLGTKAKAQPQTITAADLAARGPGANAHIVLTNFAPTGNYVAYGKKGPGGNMIGRWQRAMIPAVPIAGNPFGMPGGMLLGNDIRIVLKTTKAGDEGELTAIVTRPTLQGVVVNEIEGIGGEEKKLFEQSYPGVDFNRCWILEIDREPAGVGKVLGFMGGGGMLALAGAAWMASKT
jgi:hypothetical protein